MAETTDEEQVIADLVARVKFDRDSAEEASREQRKYQEDLEKLIGDSELKLSTQFEAATQLKLEKQKRHLEEMEKTLKTYWDARLKLNKEGADAEVRIVEQRDSDMKRLGDMREQLYSSEATRQAGFARETAPEMAGGGFGAALNRGGIGKFLSAIGWGGLAGLGGLGAIATNFAESVGEARASFGVAAGVGSLANRDEGFMFGMIPGLTHLERQYGVSRQDLGRTAGEFSAIAPVGEEGGRQVLGLTEEATFMGKGMGVSGQTIARLMSQFAILEGVALPELGARIIEVSKTAADASIPMHHFMQTLSGLVDQGRQYGRSIDESIAVTRMFAHELEQGVISQQQLNSIRNVGMGGGQGARAMLAQRVLQGGGPVADMLEQFGMTDPLMAMHGVSAIAQGNIITAEGFRRPHGQAEIDQVHAMQASITNIYGGMIGGVAEGLSGMGSGPQFEAMLSMLGPTFGFPGVGYGEIGGTMDFYGGVGEGSRGMLRGVTPFSDVASAVLRGKNVSRRNLSDFQKIWKGVQSLGDPLAESFFGSMNRGLDEDPNAPSAWMGGSGAPSREYFINLNIRDDTRGGVIPEIEGDSNTSPEGRE